MRQHLTVVTTLSCSYVAVLQASSPASNGKAWYCTRPASALMGRRISYWVIIITAQRCCCVDGVSCNGQLIGGWLRVSVASALCCTGYDAAVVHGLVYLHSVGTLHPVFNRGTGLSIW